MLDPTHDTLHSLTRSCAKVRLQLQCAVNCRSPCQKPATFLKRPITHPEADKQQFALLTSSVLHQTH